MYIFGYGSLMNSASRQLTGQTGQAIPVIVQGLVRHWGKIDDSYIMSPLVVQRGDSEVNGVLLHVSDTELPDSPNHPEWPHESCWLSPGDDYQSTTIYQFGA